MKIGSLFTGIGGLELGIFNTVASIVPYDNNIEWIAETDGAALGNACTPQQASEAFYHGLLQLTRERTN